MHKILWTVSLLPLVLLYSPCVWGLGETLTDKGVDALKLQAPPYGLTGKGIFVGQVELSRPSQFGMDKIVNKWLQLDRLVVRPFNVFFRDGKAQPNRNTDDHSHQVAAVIISRSKIYLGIAPFANLVSSAYALKKQDGQPEAAIAAQFIAMQNQGDVRAINMSFGEPLDEDPRPQTILDGNALLTLCIDWLASEFNGLPVVAGNQGKGGIPIPTDQFNGITVGFTREQDGIYRQLDRGNLIDEPYIDRNGNGRYDKGEYFTDLNKDQKWTAGVESPINGRRSLSLLAPGVGIIAPNLKNKFIPISGSSFAAPHVTGAIALLQEFAETQIKSGIWTTAARRHEVTKAVLLNSADKIQDLGNGLRLGMTKTILDYDGRNWLESEAYRSRQIPLSLHLGAGQLNVYRAFLQFKAGMQSPNLPIAAIGWDHNRVKSDRFQEYQFSKSLKQDSFVSITLTWDRLVKLNDSNGNGKFDLGESFKNGGINHLYLYLMRKQDQDVAQNLWSSVSAVDNLQHIFIKIPKTGEYKFRVVLASPEANHSQNYGLAWWSVFD